MTITACLGEGGGGVGGKCECTKFNAIYSTSMPNGQQVDAVCEQLMKTISMPEMWECSGQEQRGVR